jgi:hypothetical protein
MLDRRSLLRGAMLALAGTASLSAVAEAQPYGPPPRHGPGRPPPPPPPRPDGPRGRAPGRAYVWRPGAWTWTGNGYAWNPGGWVERRRRGAWQQGRWVDRGGRWVWVEPGWR